LTFRPTAVAEEKANILGGNEPIVYQACKPLEVPTPPEIFLHEDAFWKPIADAVQKVKCVTLDWTAIAHKGIEGREAINDIGYSPIQRVIKHESNGTILVMIDYGDGRTPEVRIKQVRFSEEEITGSHGLGRRSI